MKNIFSLTLFVLLLHSAPEPAFAAQDASRDIQRARLESCAPPKFPYGPGLRPHGEAITLSLRQQVLDPNGRYQDLSSAGDLIKLGGSELLFRFSVRNASIHDAKDVVISHRFVSEQQNQRAVSMNAVTSAIYDPLSRSFRIEDIPAGESAVVTFRLLLSDELGQDTSQNILRIVSFRPKDESGKTPRKVGIGSRATLCFKGDESSPPTSYTLSATPSRREPQGPGTVRVEKRVNASEALPGSELVYTITVRNNSSNPVYNVQVQDRFNTSQLVVVESGNAQRTGFGLQWNISDLSPGQNWVSNYRTRIADTVAPGTILPGTVSISSDNLASMPRTLLSDRAEIRVFGEGFVVPSTGVNMPRAIALFTFIFSVLLICVSGALLAPKRKAIIV